MSVVQCQYVPYVKNFVEQQFKIPSVLHMAPQIVSGGATRPCQATARRKRQGAGPLACPASTMHACLRTVRWRLHTAPPAAKPPPPPARHVNFSQKNEQNELLSALNSRFTVHRERPPPGTLRVHDILVVPEPVLVVLVVLVQVVCGVLVCLPACVRLRVCAVGGEATQMCGQTAQ
jgi:hypothetical protein